MTTPSSKRNSVDVVEVRARVSDVYRRVADEPSGEFHFELGRSVAEAVGYPPGELDAVPAQAVESFAGVGYHLDLPTLPGARVLDVGSGSGMDSFLVARRVGSGGSVTGLDMTDEQLAKAVSLQGRYGFSNVAFRKGFAEELPFANDSFDVVISNGVINLSPQKERVFAEIARVLRPGGQLALSDIVSEKEISQEAATQAALWASCIGGAALQESYVEMIAASGMRIDALRDNPQPRFVTRSALNACREYGVKSIALLATLMPS